MRLLKSIQFWIVLFFLIRLYGITLPPLEIAHNWRQTTVTMVARNFLEIDANILYPRIDFAGEKTGITGMEFPALNYLIYLSSLLFGYGHWYGRLINLIVSSVGLYYFYRLVEKYFSTKVAFNGTIVLLFSIWFDYSRKIMPDTFSMSLVMMGFYYGSNYLDKKDSVKNLMLFFFLVTVGVLSKLPSGYILPLFGFLLLNKNIANKTKIVFSLVAMVSLTIVSTWYFYWVPYLVSIYGFWHFFMGKNIGQGIMEIADNFPQTLKSFYDGALKYTGFAVFLYGLFHAFKKSNALLSAVFSVAFAAFLLVIFKSGFTFPHHGYYIIPFVPVMALICGFGLSKIPNNRWVTILLIAIAVEGILNQQHDFHIKKENKDIIAIEKALDQVSNRKDLILINSGSYPTPLYFAHRKGWLADNNNIADTNYVNRLKEKGLKYIVILKKVFGKDIKLCYRVLTNTDGYTIYSLQREKTLKVISSKKYWFQEKQI